MASGGPPQKSGVKDVQCRYFVNGVCSKGAGCQFSHDFAAKADMVCRYYQRGECSYGKRCRFDHVKQKFDEACPVQSRCPPSSSALSSSASAISHSTHSSLAQAASSTVATAAVAAPAAAAAPGVHIDKRSSDHRLPQPVTLQSLQSRDSSDACHSKMTVLRKTDKRSLKERMPQNWADAPVFVPGSTQRSSSSDVGDSASSTLSSVSYSAAAGGGGVGGGGGGGGGDEFDMYFDDDDVLQQEAMLAAYASRKDEDDMLLPGETYHFVDDVSGDKAGSLLCPYAQMGHCPYDDACVYLHGDVCDVCQCQALHPTDLDQRKSHEVECTSRIEKEMEEAFAEQRTQGVACGICLEVVCDKANPVDRYFGLLSECNHPFCLSCIRKWRSSPQGKTVVRTCPACRVPSYFVTPSRIWVEDTEEKQMLIGQYKSVLSNKPCKYFRQGAATCPFGDSCFYRHALPDGTLASVGKPKLRHKADAEGRLSTIQQILLAGFLFPDDLEEVLELY